MTLSRLVLGAALAALALACTGEVGPSGARGSDAQPCTIVEENGTKVLKCPDGTSANVVGGIGAKGDKGDTGEKGATGDVGAKGDSGEKGAAGDVGATGETGLSALVKTVPLSESERGATTCLTPGSKLLIGIDANRNGELDDGEERSELTRYVCDGARGDQGLQGIDGVQGLQGESVEVLPLDIGDSHCPHGGASLTVGGETRFVCNGAQGDQGVQGLQGIQGLRGEAGESVVMADLLVGDADCPAGGVVLTIGSEAKKVCDGERGLTGAQGDRGETGATGAQGLQGVQGIQGIQGETGPQGDVGPMGPQGEMGLQGPRGDPGLDGESVTVETLSAGDAHCIDGGSKFTIGLRTSYACNGADGAMGPQGLDGPMGAMGPQGEPGLMGPTGPQGPQGVAGPIGPTGFLQAGSAAGNTPFWDGMNWITSNSNLFNAGGNVGIGTGAPSAKLHVAGTFRLVDGSQGANKVLTSDANGNASWSVVKGATTNTGTPVRVCTGRTTPGATAWQVYGSSGIVVTVDTSGCGFTSTPTYVTSIGGTTNHWTTTGGSSVYSGTTTQFVLYLRYSDGSAITPLDANTFGWAVNWAAYGN